MSREQHIPTPPIGRTLYRFNGQSFTPQLPVDALTSIQVWLPHFQAWRKPKVIPMGDCDPYWLSALTIPWGKEEWRRIDSQYDCPLCGKVAIHHPQETGPGYGLAGDDTLYLHRMCDGRLVKL